MTCDASATKRRTVSHNHQNGNVKRPSLLVPVILRSCSCSIHRPTINNVDLTYDLTWPERASHIIINVSISLFEYVLILWLATPTEELYVLRSRRERPRIICFPHTHCNLRNRLRIKIGSIPRLASSFRQGQVASGASVTKKQLAPEREVNDSLLE